MKYKIILSSNSPRRKELMSGLDIQFVVKVIPNIKETYPKDLDSKDVALYIAKEKASAYLPFIKEDELVITADTIVVVDNRVLGKPKDECEARQMLELLSGRVHQVITGVCLSTKRTIHSLSVSTDVEFKKLANEEIDYYIKKYKPFDKAGAYGIQEWIGYIGVTSLKGSYFNVMGLPVQRIYEEIKKIENNEDY